MRQSGTTISKRRARRCNTSREERYHACASMPEAAETAKLQHTRTALECAKFRGATARIKLRCCGCGGCGCRRRELPCHPIAVGWSTELPARGDGETSLVASPWRDSLSSSPCCRLLYSTVLQLCSHRQWMAHGPQLHASSRAGHFTHPISSVQEGGRVLHSCARTQHQLGSHVCATASAVGVLHTTVQCTHTVLL